MKSDEIKKLSNTPNRYSNIISWSSDDKNLIINESIKTTSQLLLLPVNGDPFTSWSSKKYKEGVITSIVKSKKSDKIILCYEKLDSHVELYITNSNLSAWPGNGLSRNTVSSYPNNRMKKERQRGLLGRPGASVF